MQTIDDTLRKLAGDSVSGLGTGGMATKLQAADVARRAGVNVVIATGQMPEVVGRLAKGERIGTLFPALASPLEGRKSWIWRGLLPTAKYRWIRAPWPPCRRRAPACCPRA